jgi:transcription termination factor NusB
MILNYLLTKQNTNFRIGLNNPNNTFKTHPMAELKTKKTELSVADFIKTIPEIQKQKEAHTIMELMEKATKAKAKMWGSAIIGFGDKRLKYDSGRELDWFVIGFSPRKQNFAMYISGAVEKQQTLLKKLGKYKTGKGCLYINRLEEIDLAILKEIIKKGLE